VSLFVVGTVPVSFSADYSPSLPAVKQYEGVPCISGGIGDEELAALRFIGSQYNLKLVFAFKSGEYLADTTMQIKEQRAGSCLTRYQMARIFLPGLLRRNIRS
jgi:hypothetical protein